MSKVGFLKRTKQTYTGQTGTKRAKMERLKHTKTDQIWPKCERLVSLFKKLIMKQKTDCKVCECEGGPLCIASVLKSNGFINTIF